MSYLICGMNTLLVEERIAELAEILDSSGFGATVIDAQSTTDETIATACHASPFFGASRVVVLRQPFAQPRKGEEGISEEADAPAGRIRWRDLLAILKATPESTTVIIRHDGSLAQSHYARKALRELGWTVEQFDIPRGGELLAWVASRAQARGYAFAPGAAERMLDLLHPSVWQSGPTRFDTDSPNPLLIASEVDKLALAADDAVVSVESVETMVADRSGYRAFALNNAIFAGQSDRALVELDLMIEAGEAAERIVAQISGDVAGLAWTRHLTAFDARRVSEAAGVSESRVHSMKDKRFSGDTMRNMAEAVRNADESVKSGRAPRASAVVTPLVAGLSELARSPNRRR